MTPEVWREVARELNSIEQLARGPHAAKIARHVERVRTLVRPKKGSKCYTYNKSNTSKPTRRRQLWRRDPRCFWCGRETDITTANAPDSATVEHLYARGRPKREEATRRHLPATVLACRRCNTARGAPSVAAPDVCPLLAAGKVSIEPLAKGEQ